MKSGKFEWPTLVVVAVCYVVWAVATTWLVTVSLPLAVVVTTLMVTLHSSAQHEVLHGHPFANRNLNEALVFLPLGMVFPYGRFRDVHLEHHRDEHLTDPYDDPESNYLDPKVWAGLSPLRRLILRANNTLLGRMLFGPAMSVLRFARADAAAIRAGDQAILRDWLLHFAGMVPVIWWVWEAPMPGWAYAIAAYAGFSLLKVRTFLEHRAHDLSRGRSVIVEGQGLFALLFLNNNFHYVHHSKPRAAWYELPAIYAANREEWLKRNEGYRFASYGEVFRRYFLRAKDPVPHPLWPQE